VTRACVTRARGISASCLASALFLTLAGCGGTDSQGFWYSVTNGSERSVIVRFGRLGDIRVDPGETGRAVSSFGLFDGPIVVLDFHCRVLHTVEATTQRGNLWLRPDGTASLAETDVDDRAQQLSGTGHCSGST
jgi:hypothetical protein